MKFIHLGDLHIGKSLGDFDLIEDQKYILNQVLELAKKQKADGIVMAGDIYDRSIPSEAAVRVFDAFLSEIADAGIKAFVISGNHDSDERLNFGSSLFEARGIYIAGKYEGELYHQTLEDEFGPVNIYLMPFVKGSQVQHFYPEEKISGYDEAVRVLLSHAKINTEERNLLVAHQFVTGKTAPQLGGSEGIAALHVGTVEQIGYDCFDMFDYVALGHIHSAQPVGREEIRYSGSMLKYSLSEVNHEKSVPVVTFGKKGEVSVELFPLKPMRNVRHLKGPLKQLLSKENIADENDFVFVTLTDEEPVNDAMAVFQNYYPNTVKICYENSHTRELEQVDIARLKENKSFQEIISDFYMEVYQCEISKEELEVMNLAAKEAGIVNETD